MRLLYVARTRPVVARSPGRCSNVENAPVDGQSLASQPRPLPIYGAQFSERPRHPPVTGQQHAHTPLSVHTMSSYRGMHASLKLGFALCCHSNTTRAPIVNPPNSAQLGGSLYHAPKLHLGQCNSVGIWPLTDTHTHTHTDTGDHNPFWAPTTHAKCNSLAALYELSNTHWISVL